MTSTPSHHTQGEAPIPVIIQATSLLFNVLYHENFPITIRTASFIPEFYML
jgi:hypothetical protein